MVEKTKIKLTEAKGRPMLHWVGKKSLDYITAFPAQTVERFDPTDAGTAGNLLLHGDNKDVLAWFLANGYRGEVDLVYIDPPFDSGANYVRQVELRDVKGLAPVDGESNTLGEQIQYNDIWANDTFLQFMYERLLLIKELLTNDGSIYLHCDWRKSHYLRMILDEIFGAENFRNEITWVRSTNPKGSQHKSNKFDVYTDTIFFYTCSSDTPLDVDKIRVPLAQEELEEKYNRRDDKGAFYDGPIIRSFSMGPRPTMVYEYKGYTPPVSGWRVEREILEDIDNAGNLGWTSKGKPYRKLRPQDDKGKPIGNFWNDISLINSQAEERVGYPTQKPEELIERILVASSSPGDLILDCFIGSGTTVAVAQKLGRRWIAADINKGAIQTSSKRLQKIIHEQIEAQKGNTKTLPGMEDPKTPPLPASLAFQVLRVNDYDLQIQHNEAIELAAEHIGIERIKTDAFFDGTLGKKLVKIVPFNHPLTLLDLQMVQDELQARPQEDRDVVLVCLGKELSVDGWLADYNKHRPINKIEVIELRTHEKYGKFFVHQPAKAQVKIERRDQEIWVEIEDFISPTIVERLEIDTPLFKAQIPDWRAMVDVILIDAAYNGEVFNITLSDVPEKKTDLVTGAYELSAPDSNTTVAVKIIDMLGEEVLIVVDL